MKKLFSILLVAAAVLFFTSVPYSCKNENEPNPVEDSLKNVNSNLSGQVVAKDSAILGFVRAYNEIQENLDVIKEKEKLLTSSSQGSEVSQNQKDQIIQDIQAIYDLMVKNKQKLSAMSKKLKKANLQLDEFQKMNDHLNQVIAEKDQEISELKTQLEKLNIELSEVAMNYEAAQQTLEEKTSKLNTAFYAFGTSKELRAQGVLTKEGGFIGIGKAAKLKDNFNKNYFTQIDITETSYIPLACKKAKVVTSHSSSSYKFEGEQGKKIEKLIITNSAEFWSASKYLVIIVE